MRKRRLEFLLDCLKGYKGTLLNVLVSSILVTFLGMNWPMIYRYIINKVFYDGSLNDLKGILVIYILLFASEKILQYVWRLSESVLASDFLYKVRKRIYDKVFKLKFSEKEKYSYGQLLDIINNDVQQIYSFLVDEGVFAITCFVRLVMAIIYIYSISSIMAFFIFVLIIVNYFFAKLLNKIMMKYYNRFKRRLEEYNQYILDVLSGLRDIKLFSAGNYFVKIFTGKVKGIYVLHEKQKLEEAKRDNLIVIINVLSELVLYASVAIAVTSGKMLLGDFVSLMIYYEWSRMFFEIFARIFTGVSKSFLSLDRIIAFFDCEIEDNKGEGFSYGDIEFQNVSFSYGNKEVLDNVTLHIRSNTVVALAGVSGGGKTTLINLLLKFYPTSSGHILINDKDIIDISTVEIRNKIGVVCQNSRLFLGSIRYNLLLGKADATEEKIWEALEITRAAGFVRSLPEGIDTVINNSIKLSTGQEQRIIMARIILKDPDILIFDEATSNIDEGNEKEFIDSVREILRNKIVIIIAYRKNLLSLADKVFYLENGKIVDEGTNDELYGRKKQFRELTMIGGD